MTNARMTNECLFVIRYSGFVIDSLFEHSLFVIPEEPLTLPLSPGYRGEGTSPPCVLLRARRAEVGQLVGEQEAAAVQAALDGLGGDAQHRRRLGLGQPL